MEGDGSVCLGGDTDGGLPGRVSSLHVALDTS